MEMAFRTWPHVGHKEKYFKESSSHCHFKFGTCSVTLDLVHIVIRSKRKPHCSFHNEEMLKRGRCTMNGLARADSRMNGLDMSDLSDHFLAYIVCFWWKIRGTERQCHSWILFIFMMVIMPP